MAQLPNSAELKINIPPVSSQPMTFTPMWQVVLAELLTRIAQGEQIIVDGGPMGTYRIRMGGDEPPETEPVQQRGW